MKIVYMKIGITKRTQRKEKCIFFSYLLSFKKFNPSKKLTLQKINPSKELTLQKR